MLRMSVLLLVLCYTDFVEVEQYNLRRRQHTDALLGMTNFILYVMKVILLLK